MMKKSFFLIITFLLLHISYANERETISSLKRMHKDVSTTATHSTLITTTPSTAFLGDSSLFAIGATFALSMKNESVSALFKNPVALFMQYGSSNFDEIKPIGFIPFIPSLRFSFGKVPLDMGIHVMYMDKSFSSKVIPFARGPLSFSSLTVGSDIRYGILKDKGKIPALSVGIKYIYIQSELEIGKGNISDKFADKGLENRYIKFNTSNHVIALPIQISKLMIFFEPYMGIEPFMNINSKILQVELENIHDKSDNGKHNADLGVRFYGGFSFKLWLFYLDLQASYEVINSEFGLGTGFRFQY